LKIAKDCVETAQDKYKQQIDKRSKDPEFRLDQRVWYYNPKIPKDKSAKLHLTNSELLAEVGDFIKQSTELQKRGPCRSKV
jgi:hypothetical protein